MQDIQDKNPLRNPEYIIAFSIALISICALVVSIRQTTIMSEQRALMHQQAKAAVWPRIGLGVSKSHDREDYSILDYRISVSNAGVGPAIIKNVRLLYKGKPMSSWWHMFEAFEMDENIPTYVSNSTLSQNIIRQGDNQQILSLKENLQLGQVFYENSEHISFEITYESIYGDQWIYTTGLTSSEETTKEVIPALKEFDKEESFQN